MQPVIDCALSLLHSFETVYSVNNFCVGVAAEEEQAVVELLVDNEDMVEEQAVDTDDVLLIVVVHSIRPKQSCLRDV